MKVDYLSSTVAIIDDKIRVCGTTGEVWRWSKKENRWNLVRKGTNNSGYLQVYVPGNGTWQTHTLVARLFCDKGDRAGTPGYDVHHIDENIYNNAPSNLEVLDSAEHNRTTLANNLATPKKPPGLVNITEERSGKFTVQFSRYGRKSRKRTFRTLKEAVLWRDKAINLFREAYLGRIDWSEAPLKTRTNKSRTLVLDTATVKV